MKLFNKHSKLNESYIHKLIIVENEWHKITHFLLQRSIRYKISVEVCRVILCNINVRVYCQLILLTIYRSRKYSTIKAMIVSQDDKVLLFVDSRHNNFLKPFKLL